MNCNFVKRLILGAFTIVSKGSPLAAAEQEMPFIATPTQLLAHQGPILLLEKDVLRPAGHLPDGGNEELTRT